MTLATQLSRTQLAIEQNVRAQQYLQLCRALLCTNTAADARTFLKQVPVADHVIEALGQRAITPPGSTTDSNWTALTQFQTIATAFGETLRNASCFERILNDASFMRVPAQVQINVVTGGASAYLVGEQAPKPLTAMSLTSVQIAMSKVAAVIVLNSELLLAAGPGAINFLGDQLRPAIAKRQDEYLIAQLLNGVTGIPSAGSTAVAARADVRNLLDAVSYGANAKLYFIGDVTVVKHLAALTDSAGSKAFVGTTAMGGTLDGLPLLVTDATNAAGSLILVDAAQCACAADVIEPDRSDHTTLQMNDAPDSPPTSATSYINLWQENRRALRLERFLSVQKLRSTAVAQITGVTAIGNSPN